MSPQPASKACSTSSPSSRSLPESRSRSTHSPETPPRRRYQPDLRRNQRSTHHPRRRNALPLCTDNHRLDRLGHLRLLDHHRTRCSASRCQSQTHQRTSIPTALGSDTRQWRTPTDHRWHSNSHPPRPTSLAPTTLHRPRSAHPRSSTTLKPSPPQQSAPFLDENPPSADTSRDNHRHRIRRHTMGASPSVISETEHAIRKYSHSTRTQSQTKPGSTQASH